MTRTLVVGLGNPLAGDDGIGVRVIECLAADPRLPSHVEVLDGGTDLLRWSDRLRGADRIVIVDAVLSDAPAGSIDVWREVDALDDGAGHAHGVSPAHALGLLRLAAPDSVRAATTIVGVCVSDVRVRAGLSPRLADRVADVAGAVLRELGATSAA